MNSELPPSPGTARSAATTAPSGDDRPPRYPPPVAPSVVTASRPLPSGAADQRSRPPLLKRTLPAGNPAGARSGGVVETGVRRHVLGAGAAQATAVKAINRSASHAVGPPRGTQPGQPRMWFVL